VTVSLGIVNLSHFALHWTLPFCCQFTNPTVRHSNYCPTVKKSSPPNYFLWIWSVL